jgi:hypothetical protein
MSVAWVPQWLSADGWFGLDAGYYLIGDGRPDTGSQYRWSILYLLTNSSAAAAVCVAGFAASVLLFFGIGGRVTPLAAWVCLLMIYHRAPWLMLSAEVLALAGLLYLAIAPGSWRWFPKRLRQASDLTEHGGEKLGQPSVLANVSLRCLQTHWILWLGLSLASMLQQTVWWDGTAVALLSEQGSGWMGKLSRAGLASQIAGLIVIVLHAASLICLVNRKLRALGVLLTFMLGLAYVLVAGDWSLGTVACCYAAAFLPYIASEKI